MINHILGILFSTPVSSTRAAQTFTESESKKQSYIKAIQASYNLTIENNTSFQRRHPGQIQIRVVYQTTVENQFWLQATELMIT